MPSKLVTELDEQTEHFLVLWRPRTWIEVVEHVGGASDAIAIGFPAQHNGQENVMHVAARSS